MNLGRAPWNVNLTSTTRKPVEQYSATQITSFLGYMKEFNKTVHTRSETPAGEGAGVTTSSDSSSTTSAEDPFDAVSSVSGESDLKVGYALPDLMSEQYRATEGEQNESRLPPS